MFLENILSRKRLRQHQRKNWTCKEDMLAKAPEIRGFRAALCQATPPVIIAELKRSSPSKGVLSDNLDPVEWAQEYEAGGAAAISVLTEENFFGGSLDDLRKVREVCSLPLLRKDFLLEEWELYESRLLGADAVLLIASVLSKSVLGRFLEVVERLGMDALVEVHCREDLAKIRDFKPVLVGINNRDLHSFKVDVNVTADLLEEIDWDAFVVSESGFFSYEQLIRFPKVGAFLVGEALVRSGKPRAALEQLRTGEEGSKR